MGNRTLHMKDAEVQDSQARILGLSDEVNRLRKLVETSQVRPQQPFGFRPIHFGNEARKQSSAENEKRDSVGKIQMMSNEIRDLKRTLDDFESNKSQEVTNLQSSLTKSLLANRELSEKFETERKLVADMENARVSLQEQIEKLQIDNKKQHNDVKTYLETIKNKKKVEEELLQTIQEIKEKVEKYEDEKKNMIKAEKMKTSVATQ